MSLQTDWRELEMQADRIVSLGKVLQLRTVPTKIENINLGAQSTKKGQVLFLTNTWLSQN